MYIIILNPPMLGSIFRMVVRHFVRHQFFSILNLCGLVVGITASLMLCVYVLSQLDVNQYNPDNNKVYIVLRDVELPDGGRFVGETIPAPLADYIIESVPEVNGLCREGSNERYLLSTESTSIYADGAFAEGSFTEIFHLKLKSGNPERIFSGNHSIILSNLLARKLFGDEDALGKTVTINREVAFSVSAVYELPPNSTLHEQFLLPFSLHLQRELSTWDKSNAIAFIRLSDTNLKGSVEQKLTTRLQEAWNSGRTRVVLFPMTDWKLHWATVVDQQSTSGEVYLAVLSIIGVFIVMMACVNFISLNTARMVTRAREIGVRKMTGASQGVLISQFMTESFLIVFVSGIVSLLLSWMLTPVFRQLTKGEYILPATDIRVLSALIVLIIVVAIIAGAYPAFLLSSLKPATTLKGRLYSGQSGAGMRKALVVFQFSLSVILVFCTLVLLRQVDYLRHKDLGFDRENVLYVEPGLDTSFPFEAFKRQALLDLNIESVGAAAASPMEINGISSVDWKLGGSWYSMPINSSPVDFEYLPTLGFEFLSGRNFSQNYPADSFSVVITETAANLMGFDEPLGETLQFGDMEAVNIIGVVKDFHNADIHSATSPVIFYISDDLGRWARIFFRYKQGTLPDVLEGLDRIAKELVPKTPIEFHLLDEDFEYQFRKDVQIGRLALVFTAIGIFIGSLGLFGLSLYSTQRRVREIGLRKVLGASVLQIVLMLGKEFTTPILIALLLTLPVAYFFMNYYLATYLYHAEIPTYSFFATALTLIGIALLTVSYQSIKAAQTNPAESLKYE